LAKTHDYFVKNTALVPFVDAAAIENALPLDPAGRRNVEEFYDNSMLRELVNEGFVEKISRETK